MPKFLNSHSGMIVIAIRMMVGDTSKFIGILVGLTFASFIIIQQLAILIGIIFRMIGFVSDLTQPDIWVMNKKVQYFDDVKPLRMTTVNIVKSVQGVEWAVPLYKSLISARLRNGAFQLCNIIGIDDATLIGGPPVMLKGDIADLRQNDAVIVDEVGAETKLAKRNAESLPLQIGDVFEINDKRAIVVGLCQVTRTFQSQPTIFTTFDRATRYAPRQQNLLTYVLVKAKKGQDPKELADRITNQSVDLAAYTTADLKKMTVVYFMKNTGILINFGLTVILGFIIGIAISGQTFYNFAHDNLPYFAALKAMGATSEILTKMVLTQAFLVAALGWSFGLGLTSIYAILSYGSELVYNLPWYLFVGSAFSILLISLFSAYLSLRTIKKTDPAIVFQR